MLVSPLGRLALVFGVGVLRLVDNWGQSLTRAKNPVFMLCLQQPVLPLDFQQVDALLERLPPLGTQGASLLISVRIHDGGEQVEYRVGVHERLCLVKDSRADPLVTSSILRLDLLFPLRRLHLLGSLHLFLRWRGWSLGRERGWLSGLGKRGILPHGWRFLPGFGFGRHEGTRRGGLRRRTRLIVVDDCVGHCKLSPWDDVACAENAQTTLASCVFGEELVCLPLRRGHIRLRLGVPRSSLGFLLLQMVPAHLGRDGSHELRRVRFKEILRLVHDLVVEGNASCKRLSNV